MLTFLMGTAHSALAQAPVDTAFFEKHIRPVLV